MNYLGVKIINIEEFPSESKRIAYERYTLIAGILPFISDAAQRNNIISKISSEKEINRQTIRKYLCIYLIYKNISSLAPAQKTRERKLSADEKICVGH